MHILHIGKKFHPDHGGIESVTKTLAEGSILQGNQVSVCCFTSNKNLMSKIDHIEGVRILRCLTRFTLLSQPLSLKYIFKIICASRSADIIHFHFPNILAILALPFINRKKKLLVHWHSDILKNSLLLILLDPFVKYLLYRSNIIITTSEPYKYASKQLKNHLQKTITIPIGVNSICFNDDMIEKRLNTKSQFIISVGRLVDYKGFEILILALKYINDKVNLIIVGNGENYEKLQKLIHDNELSERVQIYTDINNDSLKQLYKNSYLFCLPSVNRAEAFGVAAVEALSCGLPIIASDLTGSGLPWVNKHNVTGKNFKTGSVLDLANSVNSIIDSQDIYRIFSKNSRARYLKEFTSDLFISRFTEVYIRLFSNHKIVEDKTNQTSKN